MILLAVDTSTTSCSVALLEKDRLLAEVVYTQGKTHSRHLMSTIQRILSRCERGPGDIGGIAVTIGPGTFTGLRIGLSTVKGLGTALQVPVVGIGSLAALAFPLRRISSPIVCMIDARRGEVYHASYNNSLGYYGTGPSVFVSPPETVAEKIPNNAILVGSGAVLYRHLFESKVERVHFADSAQHVICASSVGLLALERFDRNDVDSLGTLIPEYIRQSDAQIHSSEKN